MTTELVVRESQELDPNLSLGELAKFIRIESGAADQEYDLAIESAGKALTHAIRCGEALIAARDKIPSGEWIAWLETNTALKRGNATRYIRLAAAQDQLGMDMTVEQALKMLSGKPGPYARERGLQKFSDNDRRLAKQLRASGLSYKRIADQIGASYSVIHHWLNPDRRRQGRQKRAQAKKALERQEHEQAIKRAVKKAGAATAEAWTMAERMQDVLAQAHREAKDQEARMALSLAGEHYRKMRDEIVRALGVA